MPAVGKPALFVALADAWAPRSRVAAWAVTGCGLAVSEAGNVGRAIGHGPADRVTAAVPSLAAAAALAVGLGVLKRVVEHHHESARAGEPGATLPALAPIPHDAESAARAALVASIRGGSGFAAAAHDALWADPRSDVFAGAVAEQGTERPVTAQVPPPALS